MPVANIQVGFRQTGIYPVNPNALNPALLGLSRATDNVANLDLSHQGKDNVCAMLCFSSNYCIVLFHYVDPHLYVSSFRISHIS